MSYQEALRILGLEVADEVSVRRAYLRLLRICKPETNPEGFRRLREAYELLRLGPPWRRPGRGTPMAPGRFIRSQPGVRPPTQHHRHQLSADTSAFARLQKLVANDPHEATDEEFATLLAGVPTALRLVTAFKLLEKHAPHRATQAFVSALGEGVPVEVDRLRALSTLANSVFEQLASGDIHGAQLLVAAAAPWLDACPLRVKDPTGLRIAWTLAFELVHLPDTFPAKPRERWAAEIHKGPSASLHDQDVPSRERETLRGLAPLLSSMLDQARKPPRRPAASRKKPDGNWTDFVPLLIAALVWVVPVLMRVVPDWSVIQLPRSSEQTPLPPGASRAEQSAQALCVQPPSRMVSQSGKLQLTFEKLRFGSSSELPGYFGQELALRLNPSPLGCVEAQALSAALSQGYCTRARQALQVLRYELGNEPNQRDVITSFTDDVEQLCQSTTRGFHDIGPR